MNENGKQKQVNGNAALSYGQGKNLKLGSSIIRVDENNYKVEAEFETPFEGYRNTKLTVQTKRSTDEKHITSNLQIASDGRQFSLDTELLLSDISPLISLKLKKFDGKSVQFYLKSNKVSDTEFDGQIKITVEPSFLFEGNWNANIDNIQDFFFKANLNSPALKLNKIYLEAQNKPGKGERKIQITVKSAGKNLLTGSTNYQTREEQGKFVVEGSGSFKMKEESSSGNFKYISQRLLAEKNGEEGIDISLAVNLGKRTLDAQLKMSDKQIRLFDSYCGKPNECSRVEINSMIKHNGEYFQYFDIKKHC